MADVAVQISCSLDGELQRIILDTVGDVDIQMNSTVTTHPIVNGDMIADHMYREPITMNIPGAFSLNGGMGIVVTAAGPKLANIQALFERIKDEAVFCDIVKLTVSLDDKGVRFQTRRNMLLTSISWKERINSLQFNFGFTQALVADVQTYDVDIDDEFLPNITEPPTTSFTDTLIDWSKIDGLVHSTAVKAGFVTQQFSDFMQSMNADALVALGVGLAVAVTVLVALGSIPVGGWIAAGVVAAVIFIVGIVGTITSQIQAMQFAEEQFKLYNDDKKNQQEVVRYSNFIGNIHNQLQELDKAIHCWQVGANEEQEAMVLIDGNYYIFTFTKNNLSKQYKLVVTDINDAIVGQMTDVSAAPTSFTACNNTNVLFRAYESGAYVYLLKVEEKTSDYESARNEKFNRPTPSLTNFFIVSTTLEPSKFEETVKDIVINAIYR